LLGISYHLLLIFAIGIVDSWMKTTMQHESFIFMHLHLELHVKDIILNDD
jgi:hypothetical protein